MTSDTALHARTLSRVMHAEAWRRERVVNHFRFGFLTLVGLAEWVQRSGLDHPHLTAMPFIFLGWATTIEILNLTWLRKHFKQWIPAAITTADIAVLTVAVRIIFSHALEYGEETAREIDRAMVGLIVLLSANIPRFSWRTSVWSGVCALAALTFLRIYSHSVRNTAIATDFLVFAGIVALLVYSNRSVRTITERLLVDLRRAQEQRLSTLRALVGGVTHELNSPLGAMSGNVQLAKRASQIIERHMEEPDDGEVRRALASLNASSDANLSAIGRISSIIAALSDFARVDQSEVKRIDLCSSIDTCIDLLAGDIGNRIEFVRRYSQPLEITCRPAQVNQALMHVLRNAAESIDGDGRITVTGSHEGDAVEVTITDTGCGIRKKDLDGIFDIQFGRKGQRMGMGLGLPISHSVVQDHGGTIAIDSTVGKGTTVRIRLPVGLPASL